MKKNDYKLVYSSDEANNNKCSVCKKLECICKTADTVIAKNITAKIRIEKKARGGKNVSVIFNLPNNPVYFKDLTKKLKNHCGSGGSFKEGNIEIQGDQSLKIKAFLEGLGFKVKLAGGQ